MKMDTQHIIRRIHKSSRAIARPVKLMEVCGTHTMAIFKHGIRSLLPESIHLLSGPGCPVCVTSAGDIEAVIALATDEDVILTTFGDMMRVPGRKQSLEEVKAEGAEVRVIYSPLDALKIAEKEKEKEIVFFATGFETTSPLVAATVYEADKRNIENFSVYSVHKRVPPALRALLHDKDVQVHGFILPGHVSAIIGSHAYGFLADEHNIPSVITGFEAWDILSGILMLLEQIRYGKPRVENQYVRVVREEGNPKALSMIREVFETEDAHWRGIGTIPESGLRLRPSLENRDAVKRFGIQRRHIEEPSACQCGEVLKGIIIPTDCTLFGKGCRPERPVGPCMVSSEGSCAAYYRHMTHLTHK
jgi:hydrogenase expression/formation protein HypD